MGVLGLARDQIQQPPLQCATARSMYLFLSIIIPPLIKSVLYLSALAKYSMINFYVHYFTNKLICNPIKHLF